jgi:signal transduction histidine kinase
MDSAAVTSWEVRSAIRDPVLILPLVVGAGLAVGLLGGDADVASARVATGIALSWALVAASLVALERARWRGARILLAGAAFAVLGGDLPWASADTLWTLGFLLANLWAALLVQVVVTFPDGRPWSAPARVAIFAAYAATLGGQLAGALVLSDPRDVLSLASRPAVAHTIDDVQAILGIAVAALVLLLVIGRLRVLRGPGRRAQAPLLVAAALSAPTAAVLLVWASMAGAPAMTLETTARAVALLLPLGVAAGVVRSRLNRPQASELVVELRTEGPTSMRDRLARALGDPTLDVVYRLGDGRYADSAGQAIELAQDSNRAVTIVTAGGEEIAALVHDPALLDEAALVESVRATAGLVLENERLAVEVRSQLAEVRASRARIVAATDAERQRIERNLHDGAQQRLVTLSLALGLAASRSDAASDVLSSAQDELEEAIVELRELARGIHPTLLREQGLGAAVEALARRTPLPVTVEGTVAGRMPDAVELAAYFVVSEGLTNVFKHASASQATVRMGRRMDTLRVEVTDDGSGGARAAADSGLAGLRDRLEALDGTLAVESESGRGTTLTAEIPCGS